MKRWRRRPRLSAAGAQRATELASAFGLFPRLRQVFALGREFWRPLYKPADAAFAFGSGKRWIEQLADLPGCQVLELDRVTRGGGLTDVRWPDAQPEHDQLTNGVGPDHAMGFSPCVDFSGQFFRHLHGADSIAS